MVTDWRAWRASAIATLVMLAGMRFFLQRVWRSLLARLWKSMAASCLWEKDKDLNERMN